MTAQTATKPTVTFTPEEDAELTGFNAAAYEVYRVESKKANMIPPCWLTMSRESKDECRRNVRELLRKDSFTYRLMTDEAMEVEINRLMQTTIVLQRWRAMELRYKQARAEGNARAYFMG